MGGVTKEQIAKAKAVPLIDYLLAHEGNNFKRVGNAYYRRDPGHNSLAVSNNLWYWHSHGIGGNIIDYLVKINGYSFVDAVLHLTGDVYSMPVVPKARSPTVPEQKERELDFADKQDASHPSGPFRPPPRNADNKRVIEYLQGRGIDQAVIDGCVHRGSLYESGDGWHNAVFIGRDERGKARFAAMRGTTGDFKRDASGSDKQYGFTIPPSDPAARTAACFEAPIDAMSHACLALDFDGWRLSLGGTSLAALTRFLEHHTGIGTVLACTDNDEAGHIAAAKIAELPGITAIRGLPPDGEKDWNAALQKIRNEVNTMRDVRKDIKFIDSNYNELFRVKDGDSIKVTRFDGEEFVKPCRFIDEAHTRIGSVFYHICEFAERMEQNGNKYEAVPTKAPILHVLAARYGENLQDWGIAMTEAALKKLVGGDFETETLCYPDRTEQIRDRKIEIKGKAFGAVIRGKDGIAVCGLTDGVLTSLHPYNAQTCKRELSPATRKEPEKKETLLGELAEAKAAVAERAGDSERTAARLRPAEAR